jgi:dsRNA-specific ribonuclease
MRRLQELEQLIGYSFKDNTILVQALILKDYPSE